MLVRQFRNVAQAFNAFLQLYEYPKRNLPGNFAVNHIAHMYFGKVSVPRVLLQLFDSESQPPIRWIQRQDDGVNLLPLLQDLRGVFDVPIP